MFGWPDQPFRPIRARVNKNVFYLVVTELSRVTKGLFMRRAGPVAKIPIDFIWKFSPPYIPMPSISHPLPHVLLARCSLLVLRGCFYRSLLGQLCKSVFVRIICISLYRDLPLLIATSCLAELARPPSEHYVESVRKS